MVINSLFRFQVKNSRNARRADSKSCCLRQCILCSARFHIIMFENEKILTMSPDEFEITCRACLENKGVTDIFCTIHDDYLLGDLYANISVLELDEADGLPRMLCSDCTKFVIQFDAFRKRAQESETALKNALLNHIGEDKLEAEHIELDDNDDIIENYELCESTIEEKQDITTQKTISRKIPEELTCTFCDLKFDSFSAYRMHRRKEAEQRRRKIQCTVCHKHILTYRLRDHVNSHTKERPYTCQTCGDTFRFRSSLARHKFRHIEKKPHVCHICGKGFIQAPTLTDHIRTHYGEKLVCFVCGKGFLTKHALGNHINKHKMEHEEGFIELGNPTEKHKMKSEGGFIDTKGFQCKECNKFFTSRPGLRQHMQIHFEKRFLCSECGRKFSTKTLLISHMKTHSGVKPYSCKICSKSFSQSSSLTKHNLVHTGEKPILCIICGKGFSQQGHLTYHMRRHSGEKPYSCTYCDKSFNHTGTLKVHTRIHTGEKPFICHVCSKGFYDSSSMKKHMKVHDDKGDGKEDVTTEIVELVHQNL